MTESSSKFSLLSNGQLSGKPTYHFPLYLPLQYILHINVLIIPNLTHNLLHWMFENIQCKYFDMKFSVLLSLYKAEKSEYFSKAMESIWNEQTLKPDEIVLVKDGPLGSDLEGVIKRYQDQIGNKLKVVELDNNVGLGAALNEGLNHCSYELVARMDTDDISLPHRFEKQVSFMKENPWVAVSSAYIEEFNDLGQKISVRALPLEHKAIRKFAKSRSPLSHPVTIFKKSAVLSVGGYPNIRKNQDYGLWSLLLVDGYKFANLPDILLRMRTNDDFLSRRGYDFLKSEISLMRDQIKMGLFGWPTFLKNIAIRTTVRLSPTIFKKVLYKYARG